VPLKHVARKNCASRRAGEAGSRGWRGWKRSLGAGARVAEGPEVLEERGSCDDWGPVGCAGRRARAA
jgi:hypothetical protein